MRNIARILFVLLMALSVSCVPDNSPAEMKEMVGRLCPEHSNSFRFEYLSDQPDSIDSYSIETVLMRHDYGKSICVTTQVGCRIGCTFCAYTLGGLRRH